MFCTKCGTAVPDGAGFCTTCGTPMEASQSAPPAVYQAPPPPAPVYQAPPPVYQAPPVYQTPPPPPPPVMAQTPQGWAPPQQVVAAQLPYSGFWKRVAAYLIDSVILGVVALVVIAIVFLLIGGGALISGSQTPQDFAAALGVAAILLIVFAYIALIVIMWMYFAKMESSEKQATIGKKAMGIYVTDVNGQRITFGRASGRFFGKIVTGMIPFGIGWLMVAFTAKKQALHDMIAGTLVWKRQ
jgi:uncharacterized RDD family membrane protein YckC